MSTVAEVKSALPNLSLPELRQVKQTVCQIYRERHARILYDDAYGIWTEDDQVSAATEALALMDQEEARDEQDKAR